ncbi:MAG: NAD-binding protein [Pseudonocardiaceae bacterium]|nr:NAD-binding protein [Pseudonocardiaceae bacterium]
MSIGEGSVVTEQPTVALLGTGIMGEPMGRNMLAAGLPLRVWNRTASKADALVEHGATLAANPAEAVAGADIVLTMLADGPIVRDTMREALAGMSGEAVWLQMSTVGVEHTEQLAALATRSGVAFVDAPVLGTKQPAEQGALVVLASGSADATTRCAPVFDAVGGRTITVADTAGAGSRLKLVANAWVLGVTNAAAECVALAGELDVDPALFLDSVSGGALDLPYLQVKGKSMIEDSYPVSFPLHLAAKDARLIIEAAGNADLGAARAALAHLERAEQGGHGERDMAALYRGVRD